MSQSLPAWERGLKSIILTPSSWICLVAPCVGAWIEMNSRLIMSDEYTVAPCVGAWIEISLLFPLLFPGLVAPCVGAWIEIV